MEIRKFARKNVCRIPPFPVKTVVMSPRRFGFVKNRKVVFTATIILLLIAAWCPWITEDYARERVIDSLGGPDATYFYLGENITLSDVPMNIVKVPFGMFVYFPSEALYIVTFWGAVI